MKTNRNYFKMFTKNLVITLTVLTFTFNPVKAQTENMITGEIINKTGNESIAFANVALFDTSGITLISGTAASKTGVFILDNVKPGDYRIQISAIGYETFTSQVEMKNEKINLGAILLPDNMLKLNEVNVIADRIKAKSATGKTTFFVSNKMQEASNSGTDILKLIPGIHIDLQQNISLEGSRNIIILVDGKERDRSYLSQLAADKVDKVEIISTPSVKYDANVTGVINIVLARVKNSGIDGHVYLELPSSDQEIFLQPAYRFSYGFGKFNLFTSYNGDLRYFNITETYNRKIFNYPGIYEIISNQYLRQKTWSHRFHYGFDWFVNQCNQLNFYAFYNPFSQELDGNIKLQSIGKETNSQTADKEDEDKNLSSFWSLWYKHLFNETAGHEITFEMSWKNLTAENSSTISNPESGILYENIMLPKNRFITVKIDYSVPASEKIKLNTGFHTRLRNMNDRNAENFRYNENTFAGFGTISYNLAKMETNVGLRVENWEADLKNGISKSSFFLLPGVSIKYNLKASQNLKFTFRRSVIYPGFYQLNPYNSTTDPFTVTSGNPMLKPEKHNLVNIEYARTFKNQFLSAQLFWQQTLQAIRELMYLNESGIIEIQKQNLGEIRQTGLILSGSFGFGKAGINPYMKVANVISIPGPLAEEYNIKRKHKTTIETGLSAYVSFNKGFTASANFQYNSPKNEIQGNSFSGVLYFLSLDKSFSKGLKAGITSGIPLTKMFTYQGSEVESNTFSHYTKGTVNLSAVPLWFKISYRFSSGKERKQIERSATLPERENRKGF